MSGGRQSSGLETLIARVLNSASLQDIDRDEIAFVVFNEVSGSDYRKAADLVGLETGVLSFLARSSDWREGLKHLLSDRRLVTALANELAGHLDSSYCPRGSDLPYAFEKMLGTVELPIIRPPQQFRGRARQEEFLIRTRRELDDLSDDDYNSFKDLADKGWGEVETLAKIVTRYCGALFGESGEVAAAFSEASKARGPNIRLDKMQNIQRKFRELAEDQEHHVFGDERILCQWHFGRPTPFEGFLKGKIEIDLAQVPSRWSIKWQDVLEKYDNSKADTVGSISVSILNYYKTNIDFYRHFYAHSNEQEWRYAGSEMVKRSFAAAAEIIQHILDPNLCPDMIVPIAIGQDGFRRRVAFFVHEKHLKTDGSYSRRDIRMMFLGGEQFIQPHRFYFCPHPAKSGMFEPFLVLADEII